MRSLAECHSGRGAGDHEKAGRGWPKAAMTYLASRDTTPPGGDDRPRPPEVKRFTPREKHLDISHALMRY